MIKLYLSSEFNVSLEYYSADRTDFLAMHSMLTLDTYRVSIQIHFMAINHLHHFSFEYYSAFRESIPRTCIHMYVIAVV